jgi:RimJ/RimL family protein N-acetyltransferase
MTDARAIAAGGYDYARHDPSIDREIAFRPAALDRDLGRLHAWFNGDHVLPYWRLDEPLPVVRSELADKLADDHLTPYVGALDGVPMSYWERYWAADDALADHYDAAPADQGVHLLIGPPEYLENGYAVPLLRAMTAFQFRHPETDRVVAEPDVRNERVIGVFERCGFEPHREIAMDGKDALLVVCERERFEREVLAPERAVDADRESGEDTA